MAGIKHEMNNGLPFVTRDTKNLSPEDRHFETMKLYYNQEKYCEACSRELTIGTWEYEHGIHEYCLQEKLYGNRN